MRVIVRPFVFVLFMLMLGACGADSSSIATIAPSSTPTFRPLTAVPTFTATPTQVTAIAETPRAIVATPAVPTVGATDTPTPTVAVTRPVVASTSPARFAYFGRLGSGSGELVGPTGIAVS